MTYSGPKLTQESFHQQRVAALEGLIANPRLSPMQLTNFVENYKNDFRALFHRSPKASLTIALFNVAGKHYLKLYKAKLQSLRTNPKISLADIAITMEEFIKNFPDGSKTLIHYQNCPELMLFSEELITTLQNKQGEPGYFNVTIPGRCAEASLLQSLAMLPLAISEPVAMKSTLPRSSKRTGSASSSSAPRLTLRTKLNAYGEIIEEFINRSARFFAKNKVSANHLTKTAAALSHFDIEAFEKIEMTNHSFFPEEFIANRPIENFVYSLLDKIHATSDVAAIIRAMHATILLSPSTQLKKYLSEIEAAQLLNAIAHATFNPNNAADCALVNQLYFIKNTYPDVFPASLTQAMAPFVQVFAQQSHGSAFEMQIQEDLEQAANELAEKYPGLIDPKKFNYENPISAALGLESDITYEEGDIKVCGQVDGEKYHLYLGSGRETQRTKLRDHCFSSQAWKLVKFSDNVKGLPYTVAQLKDNIVIPTFEIKTNENVNAIRNVTRTLAQARETLASLSIDEAQQSLLNELRLETEQTIAASDTLLGADKAKVTGDLTALNRDLSQLQTMIDSQLHSVTELPKQLHHLQAELENFDFNAAERLSEFSKQTAELQMASNRMQSEAEQLKAELHSTEALIHRHEQTLDEQENLDLSAIELKKLESSRNELNEKIAAYKKLKNASVSELRKANVTRNSLEGMISDLGERSSSIELQVQSLQRAIKKNTSITHDARNELEKAITKRAELLKRQTFINEQLSVINSQLSYFETQLSLPIIGSALIANVESLLQSLAKTKQQQLDIESSLAKANKTLADTKALITAKKAIATKSKLNIDSPEFKPTLPKTPASHSTPPSGAVYYPAPGIYPPAFYIDPIYGVYMPTQVVPPYHAPGYYYQHGPMPALTPSARPVLHSYQKMHAEGRQPDVLSQRQTSTNAGVKEHAPKIK